MFQVKRVPISLIGRIADYREYHRADFESLKATITPGETLLSFDVYFDYVINKCRLLKSLWEE